MVAAVALSEPCSLPAPASEWSDSELLARLLCRDEAAWVELVHRYRRLIHSCIIRVTSKHAPELSLEDHDDIYAEVLLALVRDDMRKLRAYSPERGTKLGSWIGLITINATHDFLRAPTRRHFAELQDMLDEDAQPDETPATPLDILIDKERWAHFGSIVATLSDKDQTFVELYFGRGLDAPAVAARMDISLKTVYSKKHKIRQHLRSSVGEAGSAGALCDLAA